MSDLVLISTVSWEERFVEGLKRIVGQETPRSVVLFHYAGLGHDTDAHCRRGTAVCEDAGCDVKVALLDYQDQAESWRSIREEIEHIRSAGFEDVLIDISTMPRETIWAVLLLLEKAGLGGRYVYNRPGDYGPWLSRDPGKPRLAMKLAGEMAFGLDTMLVVVTGFDEDRTIQLVRAFEPVVVQLAMQGGSQFGNRDRNVEKHQKALPGEERGGRVERYSVNAYAEDHGFGTLVDRIRSHVGKKNIVMASLGPKLSAMSLYRVQRHFPTTALVYSPASEYNRDYSTGIGVSVTGRLPFG